MAAMKIAGRQVVQAQFHSGVGNLPRTGCNAVRDDAYMEVTPGGLYIRYNKLKKVILVGAGNLLWQELEWDEDQDGPR